MITLGAFSFPPETTLLQVNQIEAKSKVRKEIRIRSLLAEVNETALQQRLSDLRAAVEYFDQQQAYLSLSPDRFYRGRQRFLQTMPFPQESIAWTELLILTHDRYERSLAQHQLSLVVQNGSADFTLTNQGNWPAPLYVSLTPSQLLTAVHLTFGETTFTVTAEIPADTALVIDTENRKVTLGEESLYAFSNEAFPSLVAGANSLSLQIEPSSSETYCTIQFRDYWV